MNENEKDNFWGANAPLIFWDLFGLHQKYSGIKRYSSSLFDAFDADFKSHIELITPFRTVKDFNYSEFFLEKIFRKTRTLWFDGVYDAILRRIKHTNQPVILHGLCNYNFYRKSQTGSKISRVLTVHDLIPLKDDTGVSKISQYHFKKFVGSALQSVDKVIAVSNWTKLNLVENFDISDEKISVISHGFYRTTSFQLDTEIRQHFEKRKKRILYVSRFEPYKGFDKLVEAINSYCEDDFHFDVVTDSAGEKYINRSLNNRSNVHIHKSISRKRLDDLFEKSHIFLNLSKYEGFCLPMAEAVGHLKPIIYLKGSATDELAISEFHIGLDKALYSCDLLKDAIDTVVQTFRNKDEFTDYRRFVEKRPSWSDCSNAHFSLYNEIV